jgi:periplasmic divalent cation tolerance protein
MLVLTTTVATRAQAQALAQTVVAQGLAACAQIEAIDSIYHWQGQLRQEPEFRISFKTLPAHRAALEAAIKAAHPYDLPQMVVLLAQAGDDYAAWVRESTQAVTPTSL